MLSENRHAIAGYQCPGYTRPISLITGFHPIMIYDIDNATALARRACIAAGANPAAAEALAAATVAAECAGRSAVGFAHLLDYLAAYAAGRINGAAVPEISFPAPALMQVDAKGGIAQHGFDLAAGELIKRANAFGLAALSQHNSYTAGELGYYARRLAQAGLVALVAANGPALMTSGSGREAVFGTNPFAFAAPAAGTPPLVIDQASSATAFVNIRACAEQDQEIPAGWAINAEGQATTNAREAIRGALLAFGGARGANIALMIETLAAGLTGANWSLDAPSFAEGEQSPGVGLFIFAIQPGFIDTHFASRLAAQLLRLHEKGIHIPGRGKASDHVELATPLVEALQAYIDAPVRPGSL